MKNVCITIQAAKEGGQLGNQQTLLQLKPELIKSCSVSGGIRMEVSAENT